MIKLFSPYIPKQAIKELAETLSSGYVTQGRKVEQFEDYFSWLFDTQYAVSLNSGTSALETAYDLAGLKKDDEVITTPLTCAATNLPLLSRGVKIVWADIRKDTLNIDEGDAIKKITERTKAIVQVHLGGIDAGINSCRRIGVPIISDACQALGVFSGDYTCCSFQAIKHITTGDGGMLVTKDEEDYRKAKLMRWFGIDRERIISGGWESYKMRMMSFDIDMIGYKRHMNDITATLGLTALKDYHRILAHREKIFNIYRNGFSGIKGLTLIDGHNNVFWLTTVLVERRDNFARKLFNAGIETNLVQIRNDSYKIFGGLKANLPCMDYVEDKYISIPIGMHVSEENAHFIVETIKGGW